MFKNLRLLFLFSTLFLIAFANVPAQNPPPPPKPSPPPGKEMAVARGAPAQDADEPPARSTVSGRVYYENTGRPVRRSSIMLMSEGGGPSQSGSGLTDANGFFEIKNVAAGTYYPLINAPGVVSPLAYADFSQARETEGLKDAFKKFQPIEVNGINNVQVQIAAKQGGAISGRITYSNGDVAIGVQVEILRKIEDRFVPVISNFSSILSMFAGNGGETDDRGVYRYSGLPEGEYIVKVTEKASHGGGSVDSPLSPFGGMFATSSLLTVYYPNVFDTSRAQIVQVILGQENYETNMTIPDRDLFRIEGMVITAKDKKPVENAKFTLKRVGDNTASFMDRMQQMLQQNQSDEKGVWNFTELPPGTYRLTVIPPDPDMDFPLDDYYPGNVAITNAREAPGQPPEPRLAQTTREITVTDQDLSNLTVELGYGAVITGTAVTENSTEMPENIDISVVDENGEAFATTSIFNFPENEFDESKLDGSKLDDFPSNTSIQPDAVKEIDHEFRLEGVRVGKGRLQISVNGEDYYVKSATLKGVNLLADTLDFKEGDKLAGVKIVLAKDVGTVEGTILDGNNRPVKNMDFALVPTDPGRRRIMSFYEFPSTDTDGEFTVKAAPDEYAIVIFDRSAMARDLPGFYTWLDDNINNAPKITIKAGETEKKTIKIP